MTAKKGGEKVWQIGKGKINEWRWRTGLGRDDDMKEKIKERRTRNWRRHTVTRRRVKFPYINMMTRDDNGPRRENISRMRAG